MNTGDRKAIRRLEKNERVEDRQEGEVITQICQTAAGRRWVWNRLSESCVFLSSFTGDPLTMAFNEGQRNQGLRLLDSIMRHCPDMFTLMMRESNERDTRLNPDERDDADDAGPGLFDDPADRAGSAAH